eukprot:SAG11_NODE_16061_length_557_cov_12.157205_1_plen_109_part_01
MFTFILRLSRVEDLLRDPSCDQQLLRPLSRLSCNMAHQLRPTALQFSGWFLQQAFFVCLIDQAHAAKVRQLCTCGIGFGGPGRAPFRPGPSGCAKMDAAPKPAIPNRRL